jgi:hypothetical protein
MTAVSPITQALFVDLTSPPVFPVSALVTVGVEMDALGLACSECSDAERKAWCVRIRVRGISEDIINSAVE